MSLFNEGLLETLRCPHCHGVLILREKGSALPGGPQLGCEQRRERFPIVRGMPRCVNDQLDRLLGAIENRCTRKEVFDWLTRTELEEPKVSASYGWVRTGRKPKDLLWFANRDV